MPSISIPTPPNDTPEQTRAKYLVRLTQVGFQNLLQGWIDGVTGLWSYGNPQAVLDAQQALYIASPSTVDSPAEMFQRSSQTIAFLESQLPGCTEETLKLVKPFTVNSDGSVTINS